MMPSSDYYLYECLELLCSFAFDSCVILSSTFLTWQNQNMSDLFPKSENNEAASKIYLATTFTR